MSERDSGVSLDIPISRLPFPSHQSSPITSNRLVRDEEPFRFRKFQWMVELFLGVCDFLLWVSIYYFLSKLSGSYNHLTVSAFLVPAGVVMGSIGLIRGYRFTTNFASLQYASEHLIACFGSVPVAAFFLYVVASFGSGPASSRAILLLSFTTFAGASLMIRRFFWFYSWKVRRKSKFLVIADTKLGSLFYTDYQESGQYQDVYYVGAHEEQVGQTVAREESPVIDLGPEQLLLLLEKQNISQFSAVIIAACFQDLEHEVAQQMLSIHFDGIPVYSMGNFYETYWNRLPLELVSPAWVIESNINLVRHSFSSLVKRFSDLLIATFLLCLLAPLLLLLALVILLIDGSPVLFTQRRMGIHQIPFTLYKFRTMAVGSELGDVYTRKGDCRVSPLGSLLRKTRLDELPQLWNVIRGDMSLIGPRAEWIKLVEAYEKVIPQYHIRHLVRPGITGWAQVKHPYGSSLWDTLQKLSYDLYYIRHYSLKLDAAVLLKTIYVVIFGKGR